MLFEYISSIELDLRFLLKPIICLQIIFVKKYKNYNTIICFENLNNSIDLIEKNTNVFYEKTSTFNNLFIRQPIEHNLPMVDCDDTGFVGRDEIKKVKN